MKPYTHLTDQERDKIARRMGSAWVLLWNF
jgi:hypothetical protein